jgi:hypothetical protein
MRNERLSEVYEIYLYQNTISNFEPIVGCYQSKGSKTDCIIEHVLSVGATSLN